MAGTTHAGAETPEFAPSVTAEGRSLIPFPASSRTRRLQGCLTVGAAVASIYSTRREGDRLGVTLTIAAGALHFSGGMSATQARNMAGTLTAAADALETIGGVQ